MPVGLRVPNYRNVNNSPWYDGLYYGRGATSLPLHSPWPESPRRISPSGVELSSLSTPSRLWNASAFPAESDAGKVKEAMKLAEAVNQLEPNTPGEKGAGGAVWMGGK